MPAHQTPDARRRTVASPKSSEPLWTAAELADYLSVPIATLYNWRCRGVGPPGIRVGKYVRYRPDDVERWLRELEDQAS